MIRNISPRSTLPHPSRPVPAKEIAHPPTQPNDILPLEIIIPYPTLRILQCVLLDQVLRIRVRYKAYLSIGKQKLPLQLVFLLSLTVLVSMYRRRWRLSPSQTGI